MANIVERLLSVGAGLAVVAAVIATINYAAPPLQDYPEWMWQGWLLKSLWSAGGDPGIGVQTAGTPIPNTTSQVALALLNFVLPPLLAGKVLILAYLLAGSALAWWVTRDAPDEIKGSVRILLVMCIILASGFWNGYLNYQLGLIIVAAFLWWTLKNDGPTVPTDARRLLLIGIVAVLAFFTHAIVFGGVVLIVTACALIWKSPKRLLALTPAVVLTLWYMTGLLGAAKENMVSQVWLNGPLHAVQYKLYTAGKWGPFINFYAGPKVSMLQELPALYWLGVGLNLVFGAVLLGWIVAWAIGRLASNRWVLTPATVTAAVCIAGFALLPVSRFLGVVNFGERLLGIGLVAALFCLIRAQGPAAPLRSLAVIALCGIPYLILPAYMLTPRDADQRVPAEEYYSDQRYFNTRPFQFIGRTKQLATRSTPGYPAIQFETSILRNKK